MKLLILILNIFFTPTVIAQGTIFFSAELYGNVPETDPPVPYKAGFGSFTLTDNLFLGTAQFDIYFGLLGVHIIDKDRQIIRSATRFLDIADPASGAPGAYILATWDSFALSPDETSKLVAGQLYVHAPSALRPGVADVIGQITLIPEPSSLAIFGSAGLLFLSLRFRTVRQTYEQDVDSAQAGELRLRSCTK